MRTFHRASVEFRAQVPRDWHGRWTAKGGHILPGVHDHVVPGATGPWNPHYDPLAEVPSGVPVKPHRRFRKPLSNRRPRLRSGHADSHR